MPFPDYAEIPDGRRRKTKQEVEYGRQHTLRNLAGGMVDRLVGDYQIPQPIITTFEDNDPRKWTVKVHIAGMDFEESLFDFPSEYLIATLMMVGRAK